ncbi:MAG: monomethylamine:corrinoid methyltransferase [Candidatus Bathyarchaeia archaeon]
MVCLSPSFYAKLNKWVFLLCWTPAIVIMLIIMAINWGNVSFFQASWNPYGGFGGGSETLAIVSTADAIFTLLVEGAWGVATGGGMSPVGNPPYYDTLWFQIANKLALKRNIEGLIGGGPWVYSEPCTEMVVHELAYMTLPIAIVSDFLICACAAQGAPFDYVTGMEARIVSEITDASLGMSLEDANDWAKTIFEKHLKNKIPQKGKTFQECYDLKTLTPSREYIELYEKAKKEYADLGLKVE